MKVKYKGKYKSPKVYVTGIIPPVNDNNRVKWMNKKLKKEFKNNYISLGYYDIWKNFYFDDYHVNSYGADLLYKKFQKR